MVISGGIAVVHYRRTGTSSPRSPHSGELGCQLGLPDAVEEGARLYENPVDQSLVKGRLMEGQVAVLTYAVSRKHGTPRTLDGIVQTSGCRSER